MVRFRITMTSEYNEDKNTSPVEGAYWGEYIYTDERTTSNPDAIPRNMHGQTWYESGTNHRLLPNNHLARDFVYEGWLIDINTLDELITLQNLLGEELILKQNNGNAYEIEIYDGYRE